METAWIQATAAFGIYPSNTSVTNSNQYTKGGRRHLAHDALASLVVQAKKKGVEGVSNDSRQNNKPARLRRNTLSHGELFRSLCWLRLFPIEIPTGVNNIWRVISLYLLKACLNEKEWGHIQVLQDPKFKHINAFLFLPVFSTLQSTILAARSATQCAHVRWCLRRMQPPSSTRRAAVSCPALSLQISKSRLSHNGCRFCFLLCFGAPFGT